MIVPKSFQLAGVRWKVRQIAGLPELGRCDRDKATILLQKEQTDASKEVAFCHELVHAIKFTMGDSGPHNEQEVDSFAFFLHQYMNTYK